MIADTETAAAGRPLLAIEGLRKRFGKHEVLRGLDLEVPAGAVCGLVGLNGAGKTTTLECTLGLLQRDSGRIEILGGPPERLYTTAGRLGAVFDSPCLHPHLTARQALEHSLLYCGPRARPVEEVERLLGIERYRGTRVRHLSLGNRRRVSIAQALLGRPELVLLDEPFSALDAGGVEELLALIRRLNREEGTTFLLSSHQLPYLERISTHLGIIHDGRIAAGGRLEALLSGKTTRVRIRTDDTTRALDLLRRRAGVRGAQIEEDGRIAADLEGAGPAEINRDLVAAGIAVSELSPGGASLSTLFHAVVGGEG